MSDAPRPRLAFHLTPGQGPTVMFLPGYASDMAGTKALALEAWAKASGRAFLRFDYAGCGESEGDFAEQTLADWRDDALALIDELVAGPIVLVGSSMGGWLMLLVALALPAEQVAGLVGVAPAPDFTDWGTPVEDQARLAAGETLLAENPYGPEPTPTHPEFWADGQVQRLLGSTISLDCPVRLLHGQADPDVPWHISLKLAEALRSDAVQVTLIKDGDHRLSREADIALLLSAVGELAGWTR